MSQVRVLVCLPQPRSLTGGGYENALHDTCVLGIVACVLHLLHLHHHDIEDTTMKAKQVQSNTEVVLNVQGRDIWQECKFCGKRIKPFFGIKIDTNQFYCSYEHYFSFVEAMRGGS